jgi:hypothetical protein
MKKKLQYSRRCAISAILACPSQYNAELTKITLRCHSRSKLPPLSAVFRGGILGGSWWGVT